MGAAPGIAGSVGPEQQGCFLCRGDFEVEFFLEMNNTGGPVDVWAVAAVDEAALVEAPEGFQFLPAPISPDGLVLVRRDVPRVDPTFGEDSSIQGLITVTFKQPQPDA
jgi:hypothetical protein